MSILESIIVSIFSLALVFFVLAILFLIVKLLSKALVVISNKKFNIPDIEISNRADRNITNKNIEETATGELKLINVDEPTAAMIMAIVSDESQIPLSELKFKSIRAVEES